MQQYESIGHLRTITSFQTGVQLTYCTGKMKNGEPCTTKLKEPFTDPNTGGNYYLCSKHRRHLVPRPTHNLKSTSAVAGCANERCTRKPRNPTPENPFCCRCNSEKRKINEEQKKRHVRKKYLRDLDQLERKVVSDTEAS